MRCVRYVGRAVRDLRLRARMAVAPREQPVARLVEFPQVHALVQAGDLLGNRIRTLPFNGYADQVAGLYQGMDLKKFF